MKSPFAWIRGKRARGGGAGPVSPAEETGVDGETMPPGPDWMGDRFPRPWHVGAGVFAAALGIYWKTMSWGAFPGRPTQELLRHLKMEVQPATLDLLWGVAVRLCARLPWAPVSAWMGVFSAACGALAAGLLGWCMARTGYEVPDDPTRRTLTREAQARRLSGLVAGLYLALSVPFWVASTRTLPETFHAAWLMGAAALYVQYRESGRKRYLALMGFAFGAGAAEYATMLLLLPVAGALAGLESLNWPSKRPWAGPLAFIGGALPGASLYVGLAHLLYRHGRGEAFATPWQALGRIAGDQFASIGEVRFSAGFLVVAFLAAVPWLTAYAFSTRSPWHHEAGQILSRLAIMGGLLAVLANVAFSPWNLMGMQYLAVAPYVLMAASMGYMAGEFWILGERRGMNESRGKATLHRLSGAFALALPAAALACGVFGLRAADGREGAVVNAAAAEILDGFRGPTVLFAGGALDDSVRIAVGERRQPVVVVSLPRIQSRAYLEALARQIHSEALSEPLRKGAVDEFLENLMMAEGGMEAVAVLDYPSRFREYGHMVPDGFAYRLARREPTAAELVRVAEGQRPFWRRMAELAEHRADAANPAGIYQRGLCLMASRVANNLGTALAERGEMESADEAYAAALLAFPDNFSALLNRLAVAVRTKSGQEAELEAAVAERLEGMRGEQWALCDQFGYLWDARQWLPRGWAWALSGTPSDEEGLRLKPKPPPAGEGDGGARFAEKAYLEWGRPRPSAVQLRAKLAKNPRDVRSMQEMGRLAMLEADWDLAEAHFAQAQAGGADERDLQFDQAMMGHLRGEGEESAGEFERLTRTSPGDPRGWAALALATAADDPRNAGAVRALRNQAGADASARLVLASIHVDRGQWAEAKAELEAAIQLDSGMTLPWEMLMGVARETGDAQLHQTCAQALMVRDPTHYVRFQNLGLERYRAGNLEGAAEAFREGVRHRRDPTLLNNLAHVLLQMGGGKGEALGLVEEALRREPGSPTILSTRAEILMAMGRRDEARRDVLESLRRGGRNPDPLLDLLERYQGDGNAREAAALARVAEAMRDRMDSAQAGRLDELKRRMEEGSGER